MENKKELVSYGEALSICRDCKNKDVCNKSPYSLSIFGDEKLEVFDCDKVYIKNENLTMEEKPIRIIIENYKNQKITYTMSSKAEVSIMIEFSQSDSKIKNINVDAHDEDILLEKEDIIE